MATDGEADGLGTATAQGDSSAPASTPASTSPTPSQSDGQAPSTTTALSSNDGKPKSLMDAVREVVKTTPEPDVLGRTEAKEGAPTPEPTAEEQAAAAEKDGEIVDEEAALAEANAVTRRKIKKLLSQRGELRKEVETLRPDATVGSRLTSFAHENDLAADDIVFGMNAMAALRRNDYAGFYQAVAPYVRKAQEVLGLVLPQDLGGRVQQGQLTEAAARELASVRFREQQAQEAARVNAERYSVSQVQAVQSDVQRAVTSFEERLAANDPDYKAKADAIKRTAQALLLERGGRIGNVDEALDIVAKAHREVSTQFRRYVPQPRATSIAPNGHSQQPNARPAPKNLMEAALAGLENARRQSAG